MSNHIRFTIIPTHTYTLTHTQAGNTQTLTHVCTNACAHTHTCLTRANAHALIWKNASRIRNSRKPGKIQIEKVGRCCCPVAVDENGSFPELEWLLQNNLSFKQKWQKNFLPLLRRRKIIFFVPTGVG